jgi:steroid delta-isomerase-like uncharacterized protein
MDEKTWQQYIEASNAHDVPRVLGFMADDIRYEDIPAGTVYTGHEGVRQMLGNAWTWSSDLTLTAVSFQSSGDRFAAEQLMSGTHTGDWGIPATHKSFSVRAAAVGTFAPDGTIRSCTDYWDLAGWLRACGVGWLSSAPTV